MDRVRFYFVNGQRIEITSHFESSCKFCVNCSHLYMSMIREINQFDSGFADFNGGLGSLEAYFFLLVSFSYVVVLERVFV